MKIAVAGGTGRAGGPAVDAARAAGHEVVVLTRSNGVDLVTGQGVDAALEGVGAVIDAAGVTGDDDPKVFHAAVGRTLLTAGKAAGVRHHVVLSIVGADRATSYPLYAAKVAQERAAAESGIPFTILRATQFHDFAGQVWEFGKRGPLHFVPRSRTQPVAVREVGARLASLAAAEGTGRTVELGGPREEALPDMVRAWKKATGTHGPLLTVSMPGDFGRAQRGGALLPGPDAELGTQTFAEWVAALSR